MQQFKILFINKCYVWLPNFIRCTLSTYALMLGCTWNYFWIMIFFWQIVKCEKLKTLHDFLQVNLFVQNDCRRSSCGQYSRFFTLSCVGPACNYIKLSDNDWKKVILHRIVARDKEAYIVHSLAYNFASSWPSWTKIMRKKL